MAQIVFKSKENKMGAFCRRRDHLRYSFRGEKRSREASEVNAGSMLLKLGLCAAACALVFAINAGENAEDYIESSENESEETDKPGKLRFVEFPGLLSVFSAEKNYVFPMSECEASYLENNKLLCLHSKAEQSVCAIDGGIVAEAKSDSDGASISVISSSEQVWYYSGLSSIRAEKGQSISANDTIGEIEKDGILYVKCEDGDEALNLQKMFTVEPKL